jgi:hypothetical protein
MKLPKIGTCDRVEFIKKYAKGKSVLHVGCTGTPPIEGKLKKGHAFASVLINGCGEPVGS